VIFLKRRRKVLLGAEEFEFAGHVGPVDFYAEVIEDGCIGGGVVWENGRGPGVDIGVVFGISWFLFGVPCNRCRYGPEHAAQITPGTNIDSPENSHLKPQS
jgi:hypothetical protein